MTLLHTPQIHIQILAYSVRIKFKKMSKSLKFITLMKFLYRFWNLPQLF